MRYQYSNEFPELGKGRWRMAATAASALSLLQLVRLAVGFHGHGARHANNGALVDWRACCSATGCLAATADLEQSQMVRFTKANEAWWK